MRGESCAKRWGYELVADGDSRTEMLPHCAYLLYYYCYITDPRGLEMDFRSSSSTTSGKDAVLQASYCGIERPAVDFCQCDRRWIDNCSDLGPVQSECQWQSRFYLVGQRGHRVDYANILYSSGEFHYQRMPVPEMWLDIFQKFKANGLNTIRYNW